MVSSRSKLSTDQLEPANYHLRPARNHQQWYKTQLPVHQPLDVQCKTGSWNSAEHHWDTAWQFIIKHTHTHTHTPHTHTHTHTHTCWFLWLRGLSIGVMVFILYKLYVLLPYTYPTPKLSPHRRRCISIFPQKNSLCMIYKRFKLWGHWNVLMNHLLLVIPMSYPCHYTNLCPHKPHKHAHTHTHTHTLLDVVASDLCSFRSLQLFVSVCFRGPAVSCWNVFLAYSSSHRAVDCLSDHRAN